MKTRTIVLLALLGLTFPSCKKYEEDPDILWQTPNQRIKANLWYFTKYTVDGIDSTNIKNEIFKSKAFLFFIDKDKASNFLKIDYNDFGEWEIKEEELDMTINNDQAPVLTAFPGDSLMVHHLRLLEGAYRIKKLSNGELKLSKIGTQSVEIEMQGDKI